jgi:putative nucleotidyltransferase with HDIG domain
MLFQADMPTKVLVYVAIVCTLALAAITALWSLDASVQFEQLLGAAGLILLGSYTAIVRYKTGRSESGEVSFIPYLAAVTVYPNWSTAALIWASVTVGEVLKSKHVVKRMFNSFQLLLATATAGIVYLILGGEALSQNSSFAFTAHTASVGAYLLVNSIAVAGVIGLLNNRNAFSIVLETHRSSFLYDVFSVPGVYFVARAYTDWSWWGILVTVVILHGVRLMYQAKLQLENTNRELLELLVHTVEFRDPYTSGHSLRVSRISKIIARAIGLSAREVERVGRAALLHDVGKIHQIFAPILSKPGKLTPEERAIMELHPTKSAELVAKLSDFEDIVADVQHHHENFDGTGYPDRLVGRAIPIGARIINIADTIDAMTTDRPYRKALGPDVVTKEIARCRGTQFDPELCDALLASAEYALIFSNSDNRVSTSIQRLIEQVRRSRMPVAL